MKSNQHVSGLERLEGKRAVVTGANSGIGRQIADNLLALGADVVLACRSKERGEKALAELKADYPDASLELLILDQASQASVDAFAEKLAEHWDRLDILINNAGIYPEARSLSVDGIERTWATNVMGYFQLTLRLEELLAVAAPSRVIFIASKMAGGLDIDDLEFEERRFGGIKAYKQSKQANRMLARRFAERLEPRGIKVAAVHPGGIRTGIGRHQRGIWGLLVKLAFRTQKPPSAGADTATWLATLPETELATGRFWADRAERECEFVDADAEKVLWTKCEAMLGRSDAATRAAT